MVITNSPDISLLEFSALFDISGVPPTITLTNLSTGPDLPSCSWWYDVITPGGSYIHQGTQGSPDETGNWTTIVVPDTWPQPMGQIEWSGNDYVVTLYVKDGIGNVYSQTHRGTICRPLGSNPKSIGNFGEASATATVMCDTAKLYTQDSTNYFYQGVQGVTDSMTWILNYPPAEDGIVPDPVILEDQNTGLFPLGYNGPGYFINLNTKKIYDLGDNITVKIQYKYRKSFTVACNVDLCPLMCDVEKLIQEVNGATCGAYTDPNALQKLAVITALLTKALVAKQQPLCGYDVAALVEEIKEIGGFTCNCITAGSGINPGISPGSNVQITFQECGDIDASVANQVGDNITLLIKDYKYLLDLSEEAIAAGFSWGFNQNAGSCTRTYTLEYDGSTIGGACPTNIKGLFIHSTTNPIAGCPNPTWPKIVWNIADNLAIGTANDITELASILNADNGSGGWFTTFGQAVVVDSCHVDFPCHTGTVTPLIHVEDAATGPVPCVDQNKTFTTPLEDYDNAGVTLGSLSFPGNFYVQYTSLGPIYSLGNILTYTDLITALNAEPNKPSNINYTAVSGVNPSTVNKVIFDVDCDQVDTVTIFEETTSPIVIGSNTDYLITLGVNKGPESADTMTDDELGYLCALKGSDIIPWNVLKVGNYVYTVGTNNGNMYKINMTNPLYPVLAGTIPLVGGSATAFTGLPLYSGTIASHWDVYILNGYSDDPQFTYILESTSGNIWKYDLTTDTVVAAFQSNQLIGLRPSILLNGVLIFSWDGNRISLTGQTGANPQYAAGNVVYLKVGLGFNNGLIGGSDPGTGLIYALSYDTTTNLMWGTSVDGDLVSFTPGPFVSPIVTDTVYSGAWNISGGYTSLVNSTINGTLIYASGYGHGTKYIDLSTTITPASAIAFGALSPASNNHFTFTPMPGKQWGILCYQSGTPGIAKYSLTGTLITVIALPGGNIFNVVGFNNFNSPIPNGYC